MVWGHISVHFFDYLRQFNHMLSDWSDYADQFNAKFDKFLYNVNHD